MLVSAESPAVTNDLHPMAIDQFQASLQGKHALLITTKDLCATATLVNLCCAGELARASALQNVISTFHDGYYGL